MAQNIRQCTVSFCKFIPCHHTSKITHTFDRTEQPNKTVTNNHHIKYTRQNCNCHAGIEI